MQRRGHTSESSMRLPQMHLMMTNAADMCFANTTTKLLVASGKNRRSAVQREGFDINVICLKTDRDILETARMEHDNAYAPKAKTDGYEQASG